MDITTCFIIFFIICMIYIINQMIDNQMTEHMSNESNIACQNVASVYNTGNMTVSNLTSTNKIATQGSNGGLIFYDRQSQDKNYEWLSQNGTANLYSSFNGKYLAQIDQSGNMFTNGGMFAKGDAIVMSQDKTNQIGFYSNGSNGLQIKNKNGDLVSFYDDTAYFKNNINASVINTSSLNINGMPWQPDYFMIYSLSNINNGNRYTPTKIMTNDGNNKLTLTTSIDNKDPKNLFYWIGNRIFNKWNGYCITDNTQPNQDNDTYSQPTLTSYSPTQRNQLWYKNLNRQGNGSPPLSNYRSISSGKIMVLRDKVFLWDGGYDANDSWIIEMI